VLVDDVVKTLHNLFNYQYSVYSLLGNIM